jgi:hypothetical protein
MAITKYKKEDHKKLAIGALKAGATVVGGATAIGVARTAIPPIIKYSGKAIAGVGKAAYTAGSTGLGITKVPGIIKSIPGAARSTGSAIKNLPSNVKSRANNVVKGLQPNLGNIGKGMDLNISGPKTLSRTASLPTKSITFDFNSPKVVTDTQSTGKRTAAIKKKFNSNLPVDVKPSQLPTKRGPSTFVQSGTSSRNPTTGVMEKVVREVKGPKVGQGSVSNVKNAGNVKNTSRSSNRKIQGIVNKAEKTLSSKAQRGASNQVIKQTAIKAGKDIAAQQKKTVVKQGLRYGAKKVAKRAAASSLALIPGVGIPLAAAANAALTANDIYTVGKAVKRRTS